MHRKIDAHKITRALICIPLLFAIVIIQSACTGLQTLSNAVRAGDTVTLAIGRQVNATRENTVVTIIDSAGTTTTYNPGHPNVKAIINLYPDPVSYLNVGTETNQELRDDVILLGIGADGLSQGTRDWWLTIAIVDMPQTMATGIARVKIDNNGTQIADASVEIISGTGGPHGFVVREAGANGLNKIVDLERSPYYKISLANVVGTQPQAIEFNFSHNPDIDHGGTGRTHVTNPFNNKTSMIWSDDGSSLKVIITPGKGVITNAQKQVGFYITGGITGLDLSSVIAMDLNGNPVQDVQGLISPKITSISPENSITAGTIVSITGENLCMNCLNPATELWVMSGGAWSQIMPLSIDSNYMTLQFPVDAVPGNGVIWISTPGGETDRWIQLL